MPSPRWTRSPKPFRRRTGTAPAHYRAQAKAAAEAIRAAAAAVPRAEGARYVAAHDSLQYAEALSGLTFVGSITDGHNHSPGAAHLHELETALEDGGADCLFVEPGETTKLVRQVAEKGGLPVIEVSILQQADSFAAYLSALHGQLAACAR